MALINCELIASAESKLLKQYGNSQDRVNINYNLNEINYIIHSTKLKYKPHRKKELLSKYYYCMPFKPKHFISVRLCINHNSFKEQILQCDFF